MDNVREQILKAAIRKYGPRAQRDKAIEELSELIRALARCDDAENVAEEMADVRIMLDQLEIIFSNHDAVRAWEFRKLQRLNHRLREAVTDAAVEVIGAYKEKDVTQRTVPLILGCDTENRPRDFGGIPGDPREVD